MEGNSRCRLLFNSFDNSKLKLELIEQVRLIVFVCHKWTEEVALNKIPHNNNDINNIL